MSKKIMVAVSGTQPMATYRTFDRARFERDVGLPVKNFLEKTGGICPVLIFFLSGEGKECEESGLFYPPECGKPPHPGASPSHAIAIPYFEEEHRSGLVNFLVVRYNEVPVELLKNMLCERGAEDPRILAPQNLSELIPELTVIA